MSSLNIESDNLETPKTLPRKKKLCKLCGETIFSKDKTIFENKFYHKQCLYQLELSDSNSVYNQDSLKDDDKVLSKENINDNNNLNDEKLNCDEKIILQDENSNKEKIEFKNNLENLQQNNYETESSDKMLQYLEEKTNLDNLNPFELENDQTVSDETYNEESKKFKEYPVELNPFGDESDEINEEDELIKKDDVLSDEKSKVTKNPFGDFSDEENDNTKNNPIIKIYPDDLNPFAEDDDDFKEEESIISENGYIKTENSLISSVTNFTKNSSSVSLEGYFESRKNSMQFNSFGSLGVNKKKNFDTISIRSSTPEGKWKSNKKKLAPKPPVLNENYSSTSLKTSSVNSINNNDTSNFLSIQSSSENENSFLSLPSSNNSNSKDNSLSKKRIKKNKAPPLPPPLLRFVGSINEIEKECDLIGDHLEQNEKSFKLIEQKLIDNKLEKKLTEIEFSETVYNCLKLIETKCSLAKKQEELMYLKRQNKLEKDQIEVDSRLRFLLKKDSKLKTFEDLREEESLLDRLVDIIEGKNEIEENIMKIDKKDEFDKCVQKMKTFNDNSKIDPIVEDYLKNDFKESNVKNKIVNLDANGKNDLNKKKEKSKGFFLKKLSKLKLST